MADVRSDLPADEAAAERNGQERVRWLVLTGTGAALAAVGSVLLGLCAVTVLLWAAAPHADQNVLQPVRAAGLAWLLAHRVQIGTASGEFALAPLLITALAIFAAVRAGGWAARSADAEDLSSVAITTGGFAATYGILTGIVAGTAGGDTFQPRAGHALACGFAVAMLAGGLGAAWSSGLLDSGIARLPRLARPAVRAGAAGLLTLVGGGALATAVSLGLHAERASGLFAAVAGGWAGAAGVLAVCVAYLPNAAICAAAFGAGPGFAVGAGTQVALGGVQLGAAPALPLLAALPGSGAAPLPSYAAIAVPVAAGIVTGLVAEHRTRELPLSHAVGCAILAGVGGGAAFGLLAWLSAGGFGGRLSSVGPVAWLVGLAVAAQFVVLAPAALLAVRWRARTR